MKRNSILIVGLLLATVQSSLMANENAPSASPKIGNLPAAKVLFLGNSITLHGPAPDICMAASKTGFDSSVSCGWPITAKKRSQS